jgi:spore germination protein GerM
MRRSRFAPPVAAAVVTVAVAVAVVTATSCGVPLDDEARPVSSDDVPAALRQDLTTTESTSTSRSETVTVWLVQEDRLVSARHDIAAPATPIDIVTEVAGGITAAERERSLRSALPDASVVVDVSVTGGVATVALAPTFGDIPPADQVLAVGQIVLTLTDLRGVGGVRFVVDDVAIAVPLPDGSTADRVVSRDDFIDLATTA